MSIVIYHDSFECEKSRQLNFFESIPIFLMNREFVWLPFHFNVFNFSFEYHPDSLIGIYLDLEECNVPKRLILIDQM